MPRVSPVKTVARFEDYLRLETISDVQHEFVDDYLYFLAAGSRTPNLKT